MDFLERKTTAQYDSKTSSEIGEMDAFGQLNANCNNHLLRIVEDSDLNDARTEFKQ